MILLGYNFGKIGVGFLLISLAVIIFIIAYKKLLSFLSKGEIPEDKYCELYSLEANPASGKIEFFFTSEEEREVSFELLNQDRTLNQTLLQGKCKVGGNIVYFDSSSLLNGVYFYQLKTDNQQTIKKIQILN
jgi:hypothetical protein